MPVDDDLALVLRGRTLPAEDQRVLAAFAAEVAVAYQQRQLREAAAAALPAREADRMRTALLNAVSHDLRTPLAIAKATVSSLRVRRCRLEPRRTAGSCSRAPTPRSTGSPSSSPTCWICRGLQAGVLSVVPAAARAWTTSSA